MENEKHWFGQNGVGQLIASQRPNVTSVVRTMVAAYQQRNSIDFLLAVILNHKVKLTNEEKEKFAKIQKQHKKNLIDGGA